jgi:hypothetical protein
VRPRHPPSSRSTPRSKSTAADGLVAFQDNVCSVNEHFHIEMRHHVPYRRTANHYHWRLKSMESRIINSLDENQFMVPPLQNTICGRSLEV